MLLSETLIILALWLAFVWHFDPDSFQEARRRRAATLSQPNRTTE